MIIIDNILPDETVLPQDFKQKDSISIEQRLGASALIIYIDNKDGNLKNSVAAVIAWFRVYKKTTFPIIVTSFLPFSYYTKLLPAFTEIDQGKTLENEIAGLYFVRLPFNITKIKRDQFANAAPLKNLGIQNTYLNILNDTGWVDLAIHDLRPDVPGIVSDFKKAVLNYFNIHYHT